MRSETDALADASNDDPSGSKISRDRLGLHRPLLLFTLAATFALVIGIGLGWFVSTLDWENRMAIGNTGKTLSTVIRDGDALVVIGGGTTRTDLADLIDRSTLPWHRHISLLVIGTNNDQALGALELIQRGGVGAVAVVGLPQSEPIWDLIDSESARHHTSVKYLDQPTRIAVSEGFAIELVPIDAKTDKDTTGAIVRVHAGSMRFIWVNGVSKLSGLDAGDPLFDLRSNVLIDADGGKLPAGAGNPALAVQPVAARSSAMTKLPSRLRATLDSGEQLQLRFSENELRLPRNRVVDTGNAGGS